MKSIINLLYSTMLFCIVSIPYQALAQHDKCNCPGYDVENEVLTKITAVNPFTQKEEVLVVAEHDGYYIWQGDINLGKIDGFNGRGAFNNNKFWANNTIPYQIESGFTGTQVININLAAASINSQTNLMLVPRTTEPIYVSIVTGSGCSAGVGMPATGVNTITLGTGCFGIGTIMHEFLHTAGIAHEQSREDRNAYVTINYSNIQAGKEHNFNQVATGWSDHGIYDFGSIMHYGAYAFAINPAIKTITTIAGQPIGQRTDLSPGDIATINRMYPACFSTTLSFLNVNESGRYKTSSNIELQADIPESKFVLMSAGTKLTVLSGVSGQTIKSGNDGKVELVLDGCNID